jgi:hypothetical protein
MMRAFIRGQALDSVLVLCLLDTDAFKCNRDVSDALLQVLAFLTTLAPSDTGRRLSPEAVSRL